MSLSRLTRPLGLALSGLLVAATFALAPSSPALASVNAPTGLTPTGGTSSSTPTFTWNRVSHATGYQVVVSQGSSSTTLVQTTTANNRFVPKSNLPDGSLSWQVRAVTASGNGPWASASLTISPTAPPSLTSPGNGAHLSQPAEPPLFKWSPVARAVGYEVQVDNTGTWVNPVTYQTRGNSYFVDTPQAPGTWYWRVRADRGNGLFTQWSTTSSYVIDPLPDPQAAADMNTGTPQQDVHIHWQPVHGATAYQLQVGRDPDFNNIVDDITVYGTRFSPAATYDNDQYYWRVRAIDAGQNRMPWTVAQPFVFQRNWPDQPTLEYPANQLSPTVGDPMFYQWTAVRRASRYQLDVGYDPNFSPGTFASCTTTGTTFPVNGACGPMGAGATTYWRVKGLDDPRGVEGIFSAIHHFVYSSGQVTQVSPTNGATVDVPTLKWQALADVQTYAISVSDTNGNVVASTSTSSTTWTPETNLPASGNPYTWTIRTLSAQNVISPLYPGKTFNVSGTIPTNAPALVPITGIAGDPATSDFPNLTWGATTGASYYRVRVGVQGSNFWDANASHISTATYPYPAATDIGTHYLSPGTYFWFVDAYDSGNHLLGETPSNSYGEFTVKDLPAASGHEVALDGLAAESGSAGCPNSLSNGQICLGVPATPVLKWDPEPGAAAYLVYLANDQELTNRVITPYAQTSNTMWRPPTDLPDNTAQDSYFWYIRPCKSVGPVICNPDPISTHAAATNAFRKLSPPVALTTPADLSSVTTDPSFAWTDYYDTNQAATYAGGDDPSYQTAKTYRIQISQTRTFNTVVDDREVDQPFYTPADRTLPSGTLYWRVQVVDPSNNHVTWSAVRTLSNSQPAIALVGSAVTQPANTSKVGGASPFRWTPVDGASQYQIEVYRGDSGTHSPGNLVFAATTRQPAYVWANFLPPSSAAYTWRVRWLDGDGQPRPWSGDSRFTVSASGVTLTAPATNTFQHANGVYLTWNAVAFAANYRVDIRDANGNVSSDVTAATAYAPSTMNDGTYDWRIAALDPSNNPIALSTWRTFTIDGTAPTLRSFSPQSTARPKSKIKIRFTEKVAGITSTSFILRVKGRSTRLPAKLVINRTRTGATLVPKKRLRKGKVYTVKVSNRIHDAAGNRFKKFSWKFIG